LRSGAHADRIPAWDDPARPGLAASGVIGLETLLEDVLSTQTQDYGACLTLLLLMLAPQWWQRHKQDGEFVAFRFEILPRPK
jgi:hypothetical protein